MAQIPVWIDKAGDPIANKHTHTHQERVGNLFVSKNEKSRIRCCNGVKSTKLMKQLKLCDHRTKGLHGLHHVAHNHTQRYIGCGGETNKEREREYLLYKGFSQAINITIW